MPAVSKSAVSKPFSALLAATLLIFVNDGASATPKRLPLPSDPAPVAVEEQTPPARPPRQLFAEKKVQPLTPELEQALIPGTVLGNAMSVLKWWWCRKARS